MEGKLGTMNWEACKKCIREDAANACQVLNKDIQAKLLVNSEGVFCGWFKERITEE